MLQIVDGKEDVFWYSLFRLLSNFSCNLFSETMFKKRFQMATDEYSTVDALKCCKVPVLFVHGTEDHFVPIEMTYENYTACAAPKKLFIVPGADHGMSYYFDKEGYEAAIKDFWKEFD